MRRLIILAIATTLTLTACGTGTIDGGSTDAAAPPSSSATPTDGAATPTPTATPTTPAGETAPPAEYDMTPARISFDVYGMSVLNAADEGVGYVSFDLTHKQAVAQLKEIFGFSPTRLAVPPNPELYYEWYSAHDGEIDGYDFEGLTIFPKLNPAPNRRYEVRVTAAEVRGISIDAYDGYHVGMPISAVVDDYGQPWPDGEPQFLFFVNNIGMVFYTEPDGNTVKGYHVPSGP